MNIFLLWEDRAVGPISRFGPHVFLNACVASRVDTDRYKLARSEVIGGRPCAGNGNVLQELQHPPLWDAAIHVIAVIDTDKIHDLFRNIPSRSTIADAEYERWSDAVVAEVRKRAPERAGNQLEVCLLDRNLETLLAVIGREVRELDDALGKSRLHRDKILQRAAGDASLLAKACAEMPSWEHLVATVTRLLMERSG